MPQPYELFSKIVLAQDFPEYDLKRGAEGIIVEHFTVVI